MLIAADPKLAGIYSLTQAHQLRVLQLNYPSLR